MRLYVASALQRLPLAASWNLLPGLLARSEDAGDHNLPLMDWYAAEPLAEVDATRALRLAAEGKIPLVLSFMARRVTELGTPEALDAVVAELGRAKQADRQAAAPGGHQQGAAGTPESANAP